MASNFTVGVCVTALVYELFILLVGVLGADLHKGGNGWHDDVEDGYRRFFQSFSFEATQIQHKPIKYHSLSKRRKSNLSNNRLSLVWIRMCHVCKRPTNCVLDWKVRLHSESERKHLYGIFVVSIYCARNCSCLHIYSKLW